MAANLVQFTMYLTNLMQIYMQTANMTVAVPVAYATVDWHVAAVCQSGYQPWQHDQCQPSAAVVTLAANSRVHQTHSRHPDVQGSSDVITAVPKFAAERLHPVTDAPTFQHAAPDRAENAH